MNPDYTPKSLKELEANEFKDLPAKPGVYIVFWFRGGRPAPIPRILGVDERGTLYIGSAGKSKTKGRAKSVSRVKGLRDRIRELWISIKMAYGLKERKRYPHTFGPSLVYTGLCKVINAEDLWIYYKVFDECEAEYQERLAILEHTRGYGEPPPLNLQVGRQYFMLLDLGELDKSRLVGELDPDLQLALGL
jgi:hypothetical protein